MLGCYVGVLSDIRLHGINRRVDLELNAGAVHQTLAVVKRKQFLVHIWFRSARPVDSALRESTVIGNRKPTHCRVKPGIYTQVQY